MKLDIKKMYLTKNDCYKSGKKITPVGIQLHSIGTAQNSSQSLADYWNQSGVSACVHLCVDAEVEGKVLQFLPFNYRSWADGGFGNGNLITVELMESDYMKYTGGANFTVTNEKKFKEDITRSYNTAVYLFAKLCKDYGWNPTDKLSNGLYVVSSHDEGRRLGLSTSHVDPTHIWGKIGKTMDIFRADVKAVMDGKEIGSTASSSTLYRVGTAWKKGKCVNQIGAYDILANACNAANEASVNVAYKVFDSDGKVVYTATVVSLETLTARQLSGLSEAQKIETVAPLYQQCQKYTGMLASVGLAQFCLESGYATTDLAMYNNLHGMKKNLSGNTWSNSTWDGKSVYGKYSPEQDTAGNTTMVYSEFRAYPCMKDSIYDRAAYFIGAMNGNKLRYPGIAEIDNHVEQIKLIRASGYATDVNYVDKLCKIVDKWNLTQYDLPVEKKDEPVIKNVEYVVQAGSFSVKLNANRLMKKIKAKGIDAIVVKNGKQYIVQCGRFSVKANAEGVVKKLKSYGFDAIIKEV